jgi:hypothetical protein
VFVLACDPKESRNAFLYFGYLLVRGSVHRPRTRATSTTVPLKSSSAKVDLSNSSALARSGLTSEIIRCIAKSGWLLFLLRDPFFSSWCGWW